MISSNDKISIRQMQILLILNMYTVLALSLPRITVEYAGSDAWLVVILATLLALLYAYIIGTLGMMFPHETFVEYSQRIIGKALGMILSFGILGFFLIFVSLEVRVFAEINKQYLLDATPTEFIIITMLLTSAYLVRKGYECRARLAEVIFPFVFIPLLLVFFMAAFRADYSKLKPVLYDTDLQSLIGGSYFISLSFIALIFILLFVPYYKNPTKVRKGILQVVLIVGVLKLLTVVLCIARFGIEETGQLIWPVLTIMQTIQLPQAFIENQQGLIMLFWTLAIFSVIHAFLYGASFVLSRIFKTKEHNFFVLPLIPVIYFIALQPDSVPELYTWLDYSIRYIGAWFLVPIPIILWIIAKLRRVGEGIHEKVEH